LETGAKRIQRLLFEQKFKDAMMISISQSEKDRLISSSELVAIDEAGQILGATSQAHRLIDLQSPGDLVGKQFDVLFEADASALDACPELVQKTENSAGKMLSFATLRQPGSIYSSRGKCPTPGKMRPQRVRRRLPPTLRQLAIGSETLADLFELAQAHFTRALPFTIEGASGTGKSALVAALHAAEGPHQSQIVTIDCASLEDNEASRNYIATLIEQALVTDAIDDTENDLTTLVFDNIDELPDFAQKKLRSLLSTLENAAHGLGDSEPVSAIRVVATCRFPLISAVDDGRLRDDLYYLLGNTRIELPPLRKRQRPEAVAAAIAADLAGFEVELTPEAEDAIRCHSWPGNIRELRGAIRQSLLIGDGRRITLPDLCSTSVFRAPKAGCVEKESSPRVVLNTIFDEKKLLQDALLSANWNISRAARNLGMGRTTIHRKMKQFEIARPGSTNPTDGD
uniref:sigma 54-interacting transcriptional regulator n=1 Tax=Ruegeria sp. HKCCD8929 TaxID=2683006 RepID=UPI0014883C96